MATNQILNIPELLLVGSVSQPTLGYSKIFPRLNGPGLTGSWWVIDDVGTYKRLALDIEMGYGVSYSYPDSTSPYGTRIDIALGGGLTYSQGLYSGAPISVWGITPSMLSITGSYVAGYFLSTSTVSNEFQWVEAKSTIVGPTHTIPKFDGTSLTNSRMVDTGSYFYIGSQTPSLTNATFSVDYSINIAKNSDGFLYFGDSPNLFIKGTYPGNGMYVRTQDQFVVELHTFSTPTYKIIDFDNTNSDRTFKLLDNLFEFGDYTQSKYLSASNLNFVTLGKTSSSFVLNLISGSQGAIKIVDGGQGSYSLLYSDSQGIGKWGQLYGYDGLTTSNLGVGLNTVNIQGLTYSGGTFGLDYTKFDLPIKVYDTFTISLATVSVITGITYGSTYETPSFRVDQWGRIIALGTVSTNAFTGPQGPTGYAFTWQGTYATSSTYSLYNVVSYQGSSYISLGTSSPGLTPSTITQSWDLMAQAGTDGATGYSFTWLGSYATASTYSLYNVVYYEGSSYISLGTANPGLTPSTITQSWDILALGGGGVLNVTGTYGAVLVYGETGWTALGPATAGYVLTTGGTSSLPYWSEPVAGSPSLFTFSTGFTVSLNKQGAFSKTFGKYIDGDYINAVGMTIEQFIYDVVTETKDPVVTLNILNDPQTIEFGDIGENIDLSFGYTLKNAGATIDTGVLDYTVDAGQNYTVIGSYPSETNTYTYVATIDLYTIPSYTFRYTVTDSKGASASASDTISVKPYVEPYKLTRVFAKNKIADETELFREYGNVGSNVELTYNRLSPLVNVTSYALLYSFNSTNFESLYDVSGINVAGDTITDDHTAVDPVTQPYSLIQATSLVYKHIVRDSYDTDGELSSPVTVNFGYLFFAGPVATKPSTRADFLALSYVKLAPNSPFTFLPGTSQESFAIAVPATKTITKVERIEQSGQRSTVYVPSGSYPDTTLETININDRAGQPRSYKLLYITNSIAYPSAGTFEVTYT